MLIGRCVQGVVPSVLCAVQEVKRIQVQDGGVPVQWLNEVRKSPARVQSAALLPL
jgi:hypothetical protein